MTAPHPLDLAVIAAYLVATIWIGRKLGGTSTSTRSYFVSDGNIPWWAASLSIVATETSLLTVLSTPALAYGGNLSFLQIALGYIAGRFLVAALLLPLYFQHSPESTYSYLGHRFGLGFRKLVSSTFIATRIMADGVRLFAAAIPIYIFTGFDFWLSISILCIITLVYTYAGGIKSVIWVDVIQWGTYLMCGFILIFFTLNGGATFSLPKEKWTLFQWPATWTELLTGAYYFPAAFFGGATLSMASHGTDHIIVQRILACRTPAEGKQALLVSGFVVFFQFALFLTAGLLLFQFFGGKTPEELGLSRGDELVMHFVSLHVPPGIRGFFVAGLLAAAMSTLSSSLSALSGATFYDLFPRWASHPKALQISRGLMVFWCVVFTVFASSFTSTSNPVIEIGLAIAGFTYGALLGAVLAGRLLPVSAPAAAVAFVVTIAAMVYIVRGTSLAWPWYTLTGVLIFLSAASIVHGVSRLTSHRNELAQ